MTFNLKDDSYITCRHEHGEQAFQKPLMFYKFFTILVDFSKKNKKKQCEFNLNNDSKLQKIVL